MTTTSLPIPLGGDDCTTASRTLAPPPRECFCCCQLDPRSLRRDEIRRGIAAFEFEPCSECIGGLKLGNECLGFSTADFWSKLAYESAKQKPKHCLNCDFLSPLTMSVSFGQHET